MSIRLTYDQVEILADMELERANKQHCQFRSSHEGYAIIREEWKETQREMYDMDELIELLENKVFNDTDATACIHKLRMVAINLACEAIQVAAMCEKFKSIGEVK